MGVWNQSRIGSMFGAPQDTGGASPFVSLGTGIGIVAQLTSTALDSASVAQDNVIFPGFPTQRNELFLEMYSADTTGGPFGGSGVFAVIKDPAVPDRFFLQMITYSGAGTRTFDWAWFRVAT